MSEPILSPPSQTSDPDPQRVAPPADAPGRLSSKALVVITAIFLIALLLTMIISFIVWHTPAMEPVEIPRVEKG